jgi:hypothetical protein
VGLLIFLLAPGQHHELEWARQTSANFAWHDTQQPKHFSIFAAPGATLPAHRLSQA